MKLPIILLTVICLAATLAGQTAPTKASKDDQAAASSAKQGRWQGYIVRINKDQSTLSVRGGHKNNFEREIKYNSATEWTKLGKPADQSEFKEGSFVIVLGNADKKGVLHANRIDLRLPR